VSLSSLAGDERLRETHWLRRFIARPELGAVAGTLLVLLFFAITAGSSGLFSAKGIVNFLEVSAQLGILAVAVTLLMIAGEFDLSIGSMIGLRASIIAHTRGANGTGRFGRPSCLHSRSQRLSAI
jgi:simple sugar transport system permease protein